MAINPYAPQLGDRDPLEVTRATPVRLENLLQAIGPEKVDLAPAPGKWSARDILCHLADCEIVFAYRLRQGLAEDHHIIQPFDQDEWALAYGDYDAATALAAFSAVRRWNLAFIGGLEAGDLGKSLNHPERGDMTLQVVVETMGGHDLNHLRQMEAILGSVSAELAHSVLAVPHSRIRELADIAFGMEGVLRLYFGESNQPTPDYIKQAAARALDDGYTFYTENAGLLSLREALAEYYQRMHAVSIDPRREIVVTASGVQALNVAIRCVLDPGDEALVLTPAWPNGASIIKMSSARAVEIPHPLCRGEDATYEIDWQALEAAVTPRTRMVLYTSPSNPLGWVATPEDQDRLLGFCRAHSLWLIADEVYERLWYDTEQPGMPVPSILRKATRDDAMAVIQSFSKSYCMTGWRVGWLVARGDLAGKATQLNEFIVSHAASFTQKAAETALVEGEPEVMAMVERLKRNRDYCLGALRQMPLVTVPRPEGAFYLFPKIEGLADSFEFCKRLLLETRVGLAPGVAFGAGGEGSIRICYAADNGVLEPAMDRLNRFLRSI